MIWFLVYKILFKHIDLLIFEHATFCYLAECFYLGCKALIFVNFLHESCILLRLGWINSLRPTTLTMKHSFFSSADSHCVHLMNWKICDVIKFNEIWISENIIFTFDLILWSWVKGCPNWTSICKGGRPSELPSGSCVLIELSHLYNLNNMNWIKMNKFK